MWLVVFLAELVEKMFHCLVVFHLMIHLQRGERVMEMKWFVDLFLGLEKNEDLERSP
jgi:hypothetical protein